MPDPTPTPTPTPTPSPTPAPTPDPTLTAPNPADPPITEKPAEAAPFAPITVEDIKVPEGLEIDKELATGFVELVNTHKLSPDLQKGLIELQSKAMQALSAKDSEKWAETQKLWETEARADPDFGGAKFDQTVASVGKFMAAFGSDEARAAFDLTGAGNHPAIIKMLAKAAAAITEGTPVTAGIPGSPPKDAASILFPNQGQT